MVSLLLLWNLLENLLKCILDCLRERLLEYKLSSENAQHIVAQGASLVVQTVKNLPAMQETQIQFLCWEDPLEKERATHSSILGWRIPRTEEPSRLQSTGSRESDMT